MAMFCFEPNAINREFRYNNEDTKPENIFISKY